MESHMRAMQIIFILGVSLGTGTLWAQGTSGDQTVGRSQAVASDTVSKERFAGSPRASDDADSHHVYELRPWHSLRAHLHNKLVHAPIGFALSAFLLSLLALRRPEVLPAIRWLVLVAAIGSVAAYVTGTMQAVGYDGSAKEWVVDLHERLGIGTAVTLSFWAVSFWVQPLKKWVLLIGVVAIILVFVTGFFGGIIAHG
jgi:uncharacterized membrane protein